MDKMNKMSYDLNKKFVNELFIKIFKQINYFQQQEDRVKIKIFVPSIFKKYLCGLEWIDSWEDIEVSSTFFDFGKIYPIYFLDDYEKILINVVYLEKDVKTNEFKCESLCDQRACSFDLSSIIKELKQNEKDMEKLA